jgi:Dolichyl-phosphate-mannose-protein mannosyltransferase
VELANTKGSRRALRLEPNHVFRCLLGLFVLLTLALAVLIPAWEANDEPDHFRNVQTLVSGRWYRLEPGAGYSAHQAPLYYLGLAGIQKVAGLSPFTPTLEDNPQRPQRGRYVHNDANSQRRVVLLRLPSIVLGVLTIWLTRRVAQRAGLSAWGSVLASAIVATLPRFVFLSSVITNDTLVITLGAWATLLAVGLVVDDQLSTRRLLGFGVVLGLMLETKLSALPIVVALALGVVLARWVQRGRITGSDASKTVTSKLSIGAGAAMIAGLIFVAMPVLLSNQLRYGDVLASKASVEYFRQLLPPLVAVPGGWDWFGVAVGSGFATSFWYTSGWNQFRWKAETYVPLWFLAVVGLLGCFAKRRNTDRAALPSHVSNTATSKTSKTTAKTTAKMAAKTAPSIEGREPNSAVIGLLGGVALASASVVWFLATQTTQWQARTSFPGIAAFATLIGIGYHRLRIPIALQFLLPTVTLAGTLYAIHSDVINRYFV